MFYWILPLTLLIIFEIVADIFAKEYSLKGSWLFWILSLTSYVVANMFWLGAIKNGSGLARGAIIFSVSSAVIATILGVCFYNESASKIQIIGMILGVLSVGLIFWE